MGRAPKSAQLALVPHESPPSACTVMRSNGVVRSTSRVCSAAVCLTSNTDSCMASNSAGWAMLLTQPHWVSDKTISESHATWAFNVKVLTKSGAITVHRRISASAISFPVLTSKKGACTIERRRSKNLPPNSRRMTVKGPVTFRVDGFIDRRTAETLSSSYEELRAPTAVLLSFWSSASIVVILERYWSCLYPRQETNGNTSWRVKWWSQSNALKAKIYIYMGTRGRLSQFST